jgi:hypothetical protein
VTASGSRDGPATPRDHRSTTRYASGGALLPAAVAVLRQLDGSLRDLLPVVFVVAFFQLVVVGRALPEGVEPGELLVGIGLVFLGLTLFVRGLEIGLYPLGESLARELAERGRAFWLFAFAFALGFGTTVAEPALIAVAGKAARVVAEAGMLADGPEAMAGFAFQLRVVVAFSVGVAVALGVWRILVGWPLHLMIIAGYVMVLLLTIVAPPTIVGIAYDSGGVTTSTITVPLVTALGIGLATCIRGRNPLLDGFGLIAFASVMPIVFVLVFGLLAF